MHHIKNNLLKLCKEFCKENFNIKQVFNSFKIKIFFLHKDSIPDDFRSFLVYKVTCASCSCSYISEACCLFKTRIEEHIKNDNKSHIFKHLHFCTTCFDLYNSLSFKIIDKANSKLDLKIKETLHINWTKPTLNAQQNHLVITPSLKLAPLLCFLLSLFFAFLFYLLFPLSLKLIISVCYCLNGISLLIHLITTPMVSHLYLSSIIFILSDTNYRHLSLS